MIHAVCMISAAIALVTPKKAEDLSLDTLAASTAASAPTALDPAPSALPPQSSSIDEGLFLELGGGLVTTTDSDGPGEEIDFDEGFGLFVGIGKRMAGDQNQVGFDLMLEGFWTDQDAQDSGLLQAVNDVTAAGALVSGILDLSLTERLSIFGGAGIGVSWLDIGTQSDALNDFDSDEGALLTWQGRLGTRLRFSDATSGYLGYRFLNIDEAEIDDDVGAASFDLETQQHIIEVGVRFGPAGS